MMHILLSRSRTFFNLECIALCHCPDRTNRGVVISEIEFRLSGSIVRGNKSFASSHNYFPARGELLFVMLRRNHRVGRQNMITLRLLYRPKSVKRVQRQFMGRVNFCANQPRSKFLGRSHTTVHPSVDLLPRVNVLWR
jgi:hypothetical protein